jgi:hypothetical protein
VSVANIAFHWQIDIFCQSMSEFYPNYQFVSGVRLCKFLELAEPPENSRNILQFRNSASSSGSTHLAVARKYFASDCLAGFAGYSRAKTDDGATLALSS